MTINALSIIPCKTASCSVMGDYAIKKKMNVKWGKHKVGDLVLFDFNHNGTSDHIGIVIGINGNKITTIEGNTSSTNDANGGKVEVRTRTKGQVNYFVRPNYSKTVTADMVIATAKAEVGVKESPKNSNKVTYNTWFYGKVLQGKAYPWCATYICWLFAHVKEPEKPITKPSGKYAGTIPAPKLKKGSKGDKVKQLQKFLNWYHPAWKLTVDGKFGGHTDTALKGFQKAEKIGIDGVYGNNSYKHAKAYEYVPPKPTPKPAPKPAPKPTTPTKVTNAQKLINKMIDLAWAYGTASKKYSYKDGSPKATCKTAMKKYGYNTKEKWSDCGRFVTTVVRESGVDKTFTALHGVKEPFPKSDKAFNIVLSGKAIPSGFLKAGDIIRYKKTNGKQHAMFFMGGGKVCEASHKSRFGAIVKDEKRYNTQSKKSTIQVLRAKE